MVNKKTQRLCISLFTGVLFYASPLSGSLSSEDTENLKDAKPSVKIKVLSVANYSLLRGRTLYMVSLEKGASTYVKPFYRSSGLNSGMAQVCFPFENISGRFLENRFVQNYVEKTPVKKYDYDEVIKVLPPSFSALSHRIGGMLNLQISAFLGGGLWDHPDGIHLRHKLDIGEYFQENAIKAIPLDTASSVRQWMQSFDYKIFPGDLWNNQRHYAQFSYEVMLSLIHHLEKKKRADIQGSFRDLCLKVAQTVRPRVMQLIAPGFSHLASSSDFSKFVDENFTQQEYRIQREGFLPLTLSFYFPNTGSYRLEEDLQIFRQLKVVRKNDYPTIMVQPVLEMNKRIKGYLAQPLRNTEPGMAKKRIRDRSIIRSYTTLLILRDTRGSAHHAQSSKTNAEEEVVKTPVLERH